MKKTAFLILLGCSALSGLAQLSKTDSLYIALQKQDSIFFERSFNRCDLAYLDTAIHHDLIFFHDIGGMQDREKFLLAVKNNLCGKGTQKPIRKVEPGSLEVYPLYSEGKLYGVIQMGLHNFYQREAGKPDKWSSRAKFTHVWLLQNNRWLLKEVLSYDHTTTQL